MYAVRDARTLDGRYTREILTARKGQRPTSWIDFVEVREFLRERGFVLAHLIDGHANHETGELREVDGVFLNTRLAPPEA